jgi:hypothetical protein
VAQICHSCHAPKLDRTLVRKLTMQESLWVSICRRYTAVLQVQRAVREYSRAARRYALQTAAALRLQATARGWAARRQARDRLMLFSRTCMPITERPGVK